MVAPKICVDYSTCSAEELLLFINQRKLNNDLKDALAQCLRSADQKTSFRFLDLPAEIRNIVYAEVSQSDEAGDNIRRITTQRNLLRACNQIYTEAIATVNKTASFPLCVLGPSLTRRVDVYANGRKFTIPDGSPSRGNPWSTPMTRLTSLAVDIFISMPAPDVGPITGTKLHETLKLLHKFVTQNTRIRSLHITIRSLLQVGPDEQSIPDILAPLIALCGMMQNISISFNGVPKTIADRLRETANAFLSLRALEPELQEVLAVRERKGLHGLWGSDTMARYQALFTNRFQKLASLPELR